jgi:hypothetical protein
VRCSASWNAQNQTLALGGKRQTGADVIAPQLRKIGQDPLLTDTRGKVRCHITDVNSRFPPAWLPEPNFGIHNDPILVIHAGDNSERFTRLKNRTAPPQVEDFLRDF